MSASSAPSTIAQQASKVVHSFVAFCLSADSVASPFLRACQHTEWELGPCHVLLCMQDPRSGEVIEKELYVTRKGATPAAEGQMGLIPGSMGQPAPGLHL